MAARPHPLGAGRRALPGARRHVLRPRGDEPLRFEYSGSYAVPDADVRSVEYGWPHGLGEIVTALLDTGLRLTALREHRTLAWKALPFMVPPATATGGCPTPMPELPLMFSLTATKG